MLSAADLEPSYAITGGFPACCDRATNAAAATPFV